MRRDEIDKILKAMCMTILLSSPKDSEADEADDKSKNIQSLGEGMKEKHGMDYWVRTQKEQWPGSEIDITTVESSWQKNTRKIMKR